MNRITFPLKKSTQGAAVADLQDALQLLLDRGILLASAEGVLRELSAALARDRAAQTCGDATQRLVSSFQEEHRLQVSASVEEPTADALNVVLAGLGAVDGGPSADEPPFEVKGTVRLADGAPPPASRCPPSIGICAAKSCSEIARPIEMAFTRSGTAQASFASWKRAAPTLRRP